MTERKATANRRRFFSGGWFGWVLEGWVEVVPGRIVALDEFNFLFAGGSLEFLLAYDGASDISEIFEVNEAMNRVPGGVRAGVLLLVSFSSARQMVRHAYIEVSGTAGEDVDPEVKLAGHGAEGSRH